MVSCYVTAAVLLLVGVLAQRFLFSRRDLPLPPGPRPWPLIGNILDLPPKGGHDWEHWYAHKALYGPISSVTVFGQVMILLNDLDKTLELLDRRGAKYSSRAKMVFAGELCGYNERMPFFPYNQTFRKQRKLAASQIGSRQAVAQFHSKMDVEVRRFLLRTLEKPDELFKNLEAESGSLMLDILYGYKPNLHIGDPLVRLINKVMAEFVQAVVVGAWLVDFVPWLRMFPDWLPGMGFRRIGRQWKQDNDQVMNVPVDFVKDQMEKKTARPSYVEHLLRTTADPGDEMHVRQSAMVMYSGGADSLAAGLEFFFLAMAAFPEVQKRAREEIHRIVGSDRLPGFEHRDQLPYVEAVMKEVLRWKPLSPLGPPHVLEEDDEIDGFRIPKGAMLLPNIKSFSVDSALYSDPLVFNPERFMGTSKERSPHSYVFGFGRRVCPGKLLADSHMFLAVAHILAVFDISRAADDTTAELSDPGTTTGLVVHPLPFRCNVIPRSEKHIELIRSIEVQHPWEEGDAHLLRGLKD